MSFYKFQFHSNFSDGLHALLEINLEDNELQVIQTGAFLMLYDLKVAKLARNRLSLPSDLPRKMSRLRHSLHLEELDLSHNGIAKTFVDWFQMRTLRRLNLSHNNFTRIGAKDLQFESSALMPNQISIDLSHNGITSVDVSLPYLRTYSGNIAINLNDNPIDCNCEVYALRHYAANSSAFKHVELQTSDVAKCSRPRNNATFECFSKLCVSEGACDCWILPANRTVVIDCARRNLTEAPSWIGTWDDLQVSLDLSGNFLTRTPMMKGNGYETVRSLNLADNRIASIDADLVSPTLRHLHLERNNLTLICTFLMLDLMESVQSLWLSGNPWLCDDSTSEFRRSVDYYHGVDGKIEDYDGVTCHNSQETFFRKSKMTVYFFDAD